MSGKTRHTILTDWTPAVPLASSPLTSHPTGKASCRVPSSFLIKFNLQLDSQEEAASGRPHMPYSPEGEQRAFFEWRLAELKTHGFFFSCPGILLTLSASLQPYRYCWQRERMAISVPRVGVWVDINVELRITSSWEEWKNPYRRLCRFNSSLSSQCPFLNTFLCSWRDLPTWLTEELRLRFCAKKWKSGSSLQSQRSRTLWQQQPHPSAQPVLE